MMSAGSLETRHCKACEAGTPPLDAAQAEALLDDLHDDWSLSDDGKEINRTCRFKNYYQTMAFVNALAWIAHAEDHHPDLEVGYNRCHIRFSTHAIGGLSENDFICAAKIDALLPPGE
jgi:4a-hydroxytetrahydrobiopterin dehydratase